MHTRSKQSQVTENECESVAQSCKHPQEWKLKLAREAKQGKRKATRKDQRKARFSRAEMMITDDRGNNCPITEQAMSQEVRCPSPGLLSSSEAQAPLIGSVTLGLPSLEAWLGQMAPHLPFKSKSATGLFTMRMDHVILIGKQKYHQTRLPICDPSS